MKLVVDTNILFSYFSVSSFTKKLIDLNEFLFSPDFALIELKKYSQLIMKKSKISESDFNLLLKELKKKVRFVKSKDYSNFLDLAQDISPDVKDKDFFALSLKKEIPLWSNDKKLKEQDKVVVFSTEDLVEILDFNLAHLPGF